MSQPCLCAALALQPGVLQQTKAGWERTAVLLCSSRLPKQHMLRVRRAFHMSEPGRMRRAKLNMFQTRRWLRVCLASSARTAGSAGSGKHCPIGPARHGFKN